MSRCHLHLPILDSSGTVYPYASLRFTDEAGQPIAEPIYVQPTGGNPISQPLFADPAVVDIWTDNPVRVQIVASMANNVQVRLEGVDLLPDAARMVRTPGRIRVSDIDSTSSATVLMSSRPQEAAFRLVDPVGTHQHEGDSTGSVVLTGEEPADYNPYQTWIGFHAGENSAASSAGSSALGPHAVVQGASSTLLGIGQVLPQTGTGIPGDTATVLSGEDGTASAGTTSVGAANVTAQGANMTLLGSVNGPSSPTSVPDGSVVVGSGNVIGAAGAVKVGANHPAANAGANQTAIGNANSAQSNGLPWSPTGSQAGVALGIATTLAGDPSTALSSDDWFGGVGPLAAGLNSVSFNPSLINLTGTLASQTSLQVLGDAVANGHRTYSATSTTLGFYGATGTTRPKVPYNVGDVTNAQLRALCQALARVGLIYVTDVPVVGESGGHPDGSALEFAETGQALQWLLPPSSPDYRPVSPFTVASNQVVLNAALAPFPTRGCPALYSAGLADVTVQGVFGYNPTGTNLCTNSGFEVDLSGWSARDGAGIFLDAAHVRFGLSAMVVSPSGTAPGARAAYALDGVVAGNQYHWSTWVYPAASRNVRISVEYLDGASAPVGAGDAYDVVLPVNTWSRIGVASTTPVGATKARFLVGYFQTAGTVPGADLLWVDGAMVASGTAQQPFVDENGYHPNDRHTGLMLRSYNAQSVVSSQTRAVVTGYLVGRVAVYAMTGNIVSSIVTNLSSPIASGDVLSADCLGTSVTVRKNGVSVATFTDSTSSTRVKHGFRVCETTSASAFQVLPFGF